MQRGAIASARQSLEEGCEAALPARYRCRAERNCFRASSRWRCWRRACSLSSRQIADRAPKRRKARPSVPVTAAPVVLKTVPVRLLAIGNVEPYTTVAIKARVDGQIVAVKFKEGDEVAQGRGAVRDRSRGRSRPASGRRRRTCSRTRRCSTARASRRSATRTCCGKKFISPDAYEQVRDQRRRPPPRRSRADEAAIESAEAAARLLHDPRAGHRLRRQDHDPAGQPGEGQRHQPAGHDQPGRADLRVVLGARAEHRRRSAATRRTASCKVQAALAQLGASAGRRQAVVHRQHRRHRRPARSSSRPSSRTPTRRCGPASSSTSC